MRTRIETKSQRTPSSSRHRALVVVALAVATAGALARAENPKPSGTPTVAPHAAIPQIRLAESVFDFGRIPAGNLVKHDYVFTNIGTAPLMITGVMPTCDCTTAGKWTAQLEAGKTGGIPVQFDSSGYSGEVAKSVLVTSNDPDQPNITLMLKGVVTPPIDVSPANAVFTPGADTSASETKVIRITNNATEPLILSTPECTNRAFTVAVKTVRPGKEFELDVRTVPPFRTGTVQGYITIKTNSAQEPVIAVTALVLVPKPDKP